MRDRPVVGSSIGALVDTVWRSGGTDLLVSAGMTPQMRVHGELTPVPGYPPLTGYDTNALLAELLTPSEMDAWTAQGEYDFSFNWLEEARIRASVFSQRGQIALALRMIPRRIPTLSQLGLPKAVGDFARMHQGLVLVTGPTGSGKSTTLASVID